MALKKIGAQASVEGLNQFLSAMGQINQAFEKSGEVATKASADVSRFGASVPHSLSPAQRAIHGLQSAGEQAGRALHAFATQTHRSLEMLGRVSLTALSGGLVALGAGVTALGVSSVKMAGDFEAGMNKFAAVTGDTLAAAGLDVNDFKELFLSLGAELPVSTKEVQEAAIELAKGGLDPATIAGGGLRQVLNFAAASGLDLADAATISTKVVAAWTDVMASAEEKMAFLAHSTDFMQRVANASTVEVDELSLGMYNAQGAAKLVGETHDGMIVTLAQVASGFSSNADAGTSLKTFYARLVPTTNTAKDALAELGLWTEKSGSAFFDAQGQYIGTEKVIQLLTAATKDLSDQKRIETLNTIFGDDASRVAAALIEQGVEGRKKLIEIIEKQLGVEQMAAERQKGFNAALTKVTGNIESLKITLGLGLMPILTAFLNDIIAPGIDQIRLFATAIMESNNPLALIGESINGVIPGFTGFVAKLSEVWLAAQPLVAFLQDNLQPILIGIAAVITTGVILALGSLAVSILSVVAPLALLVAGAALLASAWSSDWLGIQTAVTGAVAVIIPVIESIATFVTENTTPVLAALGAMILAVVVPAFVAWAGAAIASAAATIAALAPVIFPIVAIGAAVALLVAAWENDWLGIQTVLTTFWNETGRPIFDALVLWLSTNIPIAIQTLVTFWTGTLQPALMTVWAFLQDTLIPTLIHIGTTVFNTVSTGVQTLAGFWTNTLKPALDDVWGFINGSLIPLFTALYDVHLAATSKSTEALAGLWINVFKPALDAVWKFIQDNIIPAFEDVGKKLISVGGFVSDVAGHISQKLQPALAALYVIAGLVSEAFGQIPKAISFVTDKLKSFADTISGIELPWWLEPGSPTPFENGLHGIGDALGGVLKELTPFAAQLESFKGGDIIRFVGDLVDVLGKANETLPKVRNFVGPTTESLDSMAMSLQTAVSLFATRAKEIKKILEDDAAKTFAEAATQTLSVIGAGVEAFKKLKDFEAPTRESLFAFSMSIRDVVADFWHRAQEIGYALQDQAAPEFAEAASAAVSVIGAGVEAFIKLKDFVAPTRESLFAFSMSVRDAVADFWHRAQETNYIVENQAAPAFLEAAQKVLQIIGSGVKVFAELQNYRGVASERIRAVTNDIQLATNLMTTMAASMDKEGVEAAAAFSDAIIRVFAGIKGGIDALNALREYETVAGERMQMVALDIDRAVTAMVQIAVKADTGGVEAAAAFSDAVTRIFGAIKAGIDALDALREYQSIPADRVQAFLSDFQGVVATIQVLASDAGRVNSEAQQWASMVEAAAGAIRSGVDAINALDGLTANASISANLSINGSSASVEGRAGGGSVRRGTPYMVGERGPELMVPGMSGSVLPTASLKSLLSSMSAMTQPVASPNQISNQTINNSNQNFYEVNANYAYQDSMTITREIQQLRMMDSLGY